MADSQEVPIGIPSPGKLALATLGALLVAALLLVTVVLPAEYALEAYLRLLAEVAPGSPWMVAGLDVDILPLAGAAATRGDHVHVDLEDAPLGSTRSNLAWVQAARSAILAAGSSLASPAEVRRALNGN